MPAAERDLSCLSGYAGALVACGDWRAGGARRGGLQMVGAEAVLPPFAPRPRPRALSAEVALADPEPEAGLVLGL